MNKIVEQLMGLKPNATFLTLRNYTNSSGEIADYSLVFHMSYKTALEKSLEMIEEFVPTTEIEKKAQEQLINSYTNSLAKIEYEAATGIDLNPNDGYQQLTKGVKLHIESGNIHLYGLLNAKVVVAAAPPGAYKTVKSSELTLTKKRLAKEHPVNKFRQFIVSADKVDQINVQKMTLTPEE